MDDPAERAINRACIAVLLAGRIAGREAPSPDTNTAWHEAGHAVLALFLGNAFPATLHSVSVVPSVEEEALGVCRWTKPTGKRSVVVTTDLRKAIKLASLLDRDWRGMLREVRWGRNYARQLVRHAHRYEIAAVARALLERGELQASEVQEIIRIARAEQRAAWRAIEAAQVVDPKSA